MRVHRMSQARLPSTPQQLDTMKNIANLRTGLTGLTLIVVAGCTNVREKPVSNLGGTLDSACPAVPAYSEALDGTLHSACVPATSSAGRNHFDNAGLRRIRAGAGRS